MNIHTKIKTNGGDWTEKYGELWTKQIASLRNEFGATVQEVLSPNVAATDVPIIYVKREEIIEVLQFLKDETDFEYSFLSDITATDEYLERTEPRFEVIYNLYSLATHARIRIKIRVASGQTVSSATSIWLGADWAEREIFDMFGIIFTDHPNLRRILNDIRFEGHPLRKDYYIRKYQIFTDVEPPNPKILE